jgi:hypothetical protein
MRTTWPDCRLRQAEGRLERPGAFSLNRFHGEIAWADSAGTTGINSEDICAARNPLAG